MLFDKEGAPAEFSLESEFSAALDSVGVTNIPSPPRSIEDEVRQYAADIYRFVPGQDVHVSFTGSTLTSLTGRMPPSGQHFWYSGRALSGLRTLTLEADLSGVDSATLQFATYFKFSKAFGFGYVVISTDGGQTWTQLVTENMKGDKAQDDPYGFALTEAFYTGNATGGGWIEETIDLSEYAGQQVLIRWEADSGDRDLGFAIDNIAIPEIGFYDDVESEVAGWTTDSWLRATAYIPQTYHLILITFVDGAPVVTYIPLAADNSAEFDVSGLADSEAFLIVAASSPQSLQPTAYRIETTAR